jgi:peptidoglycan hydrolase-like protein with peptidoglycan-binding domain
LTLVGVAALAVAVGVSLPAEAKKRKNADKQVEAAIPDPADGEPMILVVSLSQQKLDVYRGMTLITTSKVSTGMRGYATKAGVFSILEKRRMHHSNLYSGAPMPFMNRITWSGTALHAGVLPGYPASHGCIRLPFSFAPKLFGLTTVGDNVIVARDRPAPQLIEHANLFQPVPPPAAPAVVKQEEPPKRQSRNDAAPIAPVKTYPGKLARADVAGTTTDIPSSLEAEAITTKTAAPATGDPAAIEDTHAHAFDPLAEISARTSSRDSRRSEEASQPGLHALDDDSAPEPSRAKAEAAPASPAPAIESAAKDAVPATNVPAAAPNPLGTMVSAAVAAEAAGPPSVAEPKPAEIVAAPAVATEPGQTATSEPEPAARVAPPALPVEAVAAAAAELKPADAAAATQAQTAPASTGAQADQTLVLLPQAAPAEATPLLPLDAPPSVVAAKLMAGAKEMAILAAEPRSTAPLRILVTRRTQRDRIIGVQRIFADMGYLEPQDFDGTLGKATVGAIKKFQAANGMPETGAINDELAKKVYDAAGKGEPPAGHLYVRQEFGRVFDAPVSFKDPETPLGTHLFTAMKFAPGETPVRWLGMSLQGDYSAAALDRLEIPSDVRQKISERLTPGSSLIIGDTSINTAGLTKGNDFVVWAKDTPAKITAASLDGDFTPAKPKKKKKAKAVRRPYFDYGYNRYQRGPGVSRGPAWPW